MPPIRFAQASDLPEIVAIYNASIPGRLATADTEPVTVAAREPWFREFDPARRPLWVLTDSVTEAVDGWLSLRSFYGRPAYAGTVEAGVYTRPPAQRRGIGKALLAHALAAAPALRIRTVLAFVFAHNAPSIALFEAAGFAAWGRLPRVAEMDGIERDLAILGRRIG
jgi:phosphinothricin acetyltransferase